jgi:hypothetical protein
MEKSPLVSPQKRARRLTRLLLAAAALMLAHPLTAARGQEADELIEGELVADGARPQFSILGDGGFVYQSDADIDGGGSLQVFRYDLGVGGRIQLLDRLRWGNTFFFGVNDYDFDGGGFSAGDPWSTTLNLRLGTTLTYGITEQWGVTAGGIFMFSPESGADWGDSFTGGGLVAGEYRHSETLFASVGVAVVSQIEDDVMVLPAVVINWLPAEDWKVRVGAVPVSGGAAAAAEVAYRFVDPIELGLGVLYQQRRFRLDDSGPAPEGVGEDDSLPVRLRLGWNINQNFSLNLLGGVVLAGDLRLENQNGNRLRSEEYDPAAYVGLRLLGVF